MDHIFQPPQILPTGPRSLTLEISACVVLHAWITCTHCPNMSFLIQFLKIHLLCLLPQKAFPTPPRLESDDFVYTLSHIIVPTILQLCCVLLFISLITKLQQSHHISRASFCSPACVCVLSIPLISLKIH